MENDSTTPEQDNPDLSQDPSNTGTEGNGPAEGGDNPDPSKSTDTSNAGGDEPSGDDGGDKGGDTPAPKFDDDLDDWATKRGMPKAETEEQKQAYQDLRNEQREFTRKRQAEKSGEQAADLGKNMADENPVEENSEEDDEDDELEKRLKAVEEDRQRERTARLQSEFYTSNEVSDAEHQAMLEIFKEKVNRPTTPEGKKAAFDLWSNPDSLPDLLDLARARVIKAEGGSDAAAEAAAKAEREKIARESQAGPSGRGAKTTTSGEKTPEQARLERFSNWD